MSNLLPPSAQRKTWRAARNRMVLTASLVMSGAVAVAMLALVPGIFMYHREEAALPPVADLSERNRNTESAALAQARAIVVQLKPLVAATSSLEVMDTIFGARPVGLRIDHISYIGNHPASISVEGNAATPEILKAFQAALASSGRFSAVSLPLGALIGSQDGRFTMTLSGAF